ncbi:MAG: hypothetical protein ACKN82_06615, partial [Pirellula sp.]
MSKHSPFYRRRRNAIIAGTTHNKKSGCQPENNGDSYQPRKTSGHKTLSALQALPRNSSVLVDPQPT